jgi:hypothetical protein
MRYVPWANIFTVLTFFNYTFPIFHLLFSLYSPLRFYHPLTWQCSAMYIHTPLTPKFAAASISKNNGVLVHMRKFSSLTKRALVQHM